MPAIKPDRLLGDLTKLRTFGTYKTDVHRPTFSPEDIASRAWFAEACTAAGLETSIDGIGNILGKSPASGRKILSGSHLESQNHAGWLDGESRLRVRGRIGALLRHLPELSIVRSKRQARFSSTIRLRSVSVSAGTASGIVNSEESQRCLAWKAR